MGIVSQIRFFAIVLASLLCAGNAWAGGWYLMVPPTEADLDTTCRTDGWPSWRDILAADRYNESILDARMLRCSREMLIKVPTAPISQWVRAEVPVSGTPSEYERAFKKLDDCETADYVARNSDVSHRAEGFVPPKQPDFLSFYNADPVLKGIDFRNKSKMQQVLEDFKNEHPRDDRARTYADFMQHIFVEGTNNLIEDYAQCIATDDPRLKGN